MDLIFSIILIINFTVAVKFNAESFVALSSLAKEGKIHLEALKEKANVPLYGPCWKKAVANLQVSCKFMSEKIQRDLALKFTDCFLQISGHEPLVCDFSENVCLKKLSDRAFNAYTEFYTHTQSMCFFLQNQLWQEEAEKTIERLSLTSQYVSEKLSKAELFQKKLLLQQKESINLQHNLHQNSKLVAFELQSSHDRIKDIMQDFQTSATQQKQILLDVLEHLLSFKSWAVDEISWYSSIIFLTGATIMGFLFTSISRTRGARIFIFIIFIFNYFFERFLIDHTMANLTYSKNITVATETLHSWIWLSRKFSILLSGSITLYFILNYYDDNVMNYKMLLEIKKQNQKILNYFASQGIKNTNSFNGPTKEVNIIDGGHNLNTSRQYTFSNTSEIQSSYKTNINKRSPYLGKMRPDNLAFFSHDVMDCLETKEIKDNESITSEKSNSSSQNKSNYYLRSSRNSRI